MKRPVQIAKALNNDESGAVLIWVSVMILVIMSMVALAIDGSRYLNLRSNMQHIADAAALAGAKRLDGSAQAIENARNDALNYLRNNYPDNWSDLDKSSRTQIATVNFYATPPKVDGTTTKLTDSEDTTATYIEVVTIPRGISTTFSKVLGAGDSAYTDERAVARVTYSTCRPMQSFLCNPFELSAPASERGTAKNFSSPNVEKGDMFLLGAGSGGSPGSWGFIDPNDKGGTTAKEWQQFWSALSPAQCKALEVGLKGPYPDTGADTGMKAVPGINTRFDNPGKDLTNVRAPVVTDGYVIKPSSSSPSCASTGMATNPYFTKTKVGSSKIEYECKFQQADTGVTDGYRNYCNTRDTPTPPGWAGGSSPTSVPNCLDAPTPSTTGKRVGSCPLPRDRDLVSSGKAWFEVKQGTGPNLDDLKAYWANHHTVAFSDAFPAGVATRYDVYLKEVENIGKSGYFDAPGLTSPPVDSTEPVGTSESCSASTVGDESRRLINVAIVDCDHWSLAGASTRLPIITKYAQFFLTEPATDSYTGAVGASSMGRMYAEFIRSYDVNEENGAIFQQVELVE